MTTSGSYSFSASAASGLTLVAFGRIGIRRAELTSQHLQDASVEANLLQSGLGSQQPHLWRSEVYDITLTQGVAEYDLPPRMIAVQDIYLTTLATGASASTATDRILGPLSLFEWDAQTNKSQQAPPTAYVIFKTLSPTIKFWQVPDGNATYTAHVRLLSQMQDASQISGVTLDMPYIYLDVYVSGLAYRLSRIYAPDKEIIRKQDYMEALEAAEKTDTQDSVGLFIQPDFSNYTR